MGCVARFSTELLLKLLLLASLSLLILTTGQLMLLSSSQLLQLRLDLPSLELDMRLADNSMAAAPQKAQRKSLEE